MQPEKPTKNHKSTFKIDFRIPNLEPKTMKPGKERIKKSS